MVPKNFMLTVIGLTGNMNKYMIIALRKRAKQTIKKFSKHLEEYNSITNSNIDFHTFFIDVLNYSEEDYLNLLTAKIKFEKRKKDRETPKKRKIDQNKLIEHGIGDIENPEYNEGNNICSLLYAADLLENSYICEADIFLKNKALIRKYQYKSNYCGIKCAQTDDWCLSEAKGIITGVSVGGTNGYRMLGISYWNKKDGAKLSECIKKAYNMPGGKERYWDSVPLTLFADEFELTIRNCQFSDFEEIDTLSELKKIDSVYNV